MRYEKKHFTDSVKNIKALNANSKDDVVYGLNKFSDLSSEEFKALLVAQAPKRINQSEQVVSGLLGAAATPLSSVDWTNKTGILTPVYNQG
jgi:hypothetical protein